MSVEVKEIHFENFGRCVQISNGLIDVVVTIDLGPRIIRLGFLNEPNVLFNDLERKYVNRSEKLSERYGKDAVFYSYGGHRVWLSPERMPETYYPDNEPVIYGILPGGVSFTPGKQKRNEMQLGFEVMLGDGASDIMVVHTAKNCSKEKQTCALWALTMANGGGIEIIPQNRESSDNHLLPNRILAAWPYTNLHDERISVTNKFITITHNPERDDPLKLGTNNVLGWAAYCNGGYTLVKRFIHNSQASYPDFGCSYETYLNQDYVVMETLSPLYIIEPGEGIRHVENLSLFRTEESCPVDEESIDQYMAQLK
ncbi:MAG TPA: hypothetical protein VHO71_06080 [Caproiciproducens sp.]|nr:hypothetical protein [Caproiciproducens sp.]